MEKEEIKGTVDEPVVVVEEKETVVEPVVVKTSAEIEAEIKARYESDLDRRITDAVKKREKALKDEFADKERKAKLTEEQRLKEEQESVSKEQAKKDRELNARSLKLDLVDVLAENSMDLKFRDLISIDDLLAVEPENRTVELKKKVTGLKKIVDEIVGVKVEEMKKEYLKGSTPKKVNPNDEVPTKTEYESAKANSDVKGMIGAKFASRKTK